QPDQLDPARDLHLRRPGGHVSDRTAEVIRLRPSRPPAWDWDWAQEGNLALNRHEVWEEKLVRRRLQAGERFVTVPRMPAPARQAAAARQRARRRPKSTPTPHRARRLIVLTVVIGGLVRTPLRARV